ncbi:MAG: UDP-N-acetylmuramoyl-tripeptide--D-alanyl-D-alanine ligase [FCB group bacterium]|nr:UDP-N-acetylmuramoyl-tripeptide--D-alanyl-D-alanine ligase [FCB group bacterium]
MRVVLGNPQLFAEMLGEYFPAWKPKPLTGFCIDSRKILPGDVYLPLKGLHYDGHDFINEADSKGAAVIFSERKLPELPPVIQVNSTREVLYKLAASWRNEFEIPVIGITGSNGKTSTKELLYQVLTPSYNILKTEANFNSTIGLPVSVFRLNAAHDLAIFEMGTNSPGEMEILTSIARPTSGLITNVHPVHLEKFKTVKNVAREKSVLFSSLPQGGKSFVNLDDKYIPKFETSAERITFSFKSSADFKGSFMTTAQEDVLTVNEYTIHLPQRGRTLAQNALSVFALSSSLGISNLEIIQRIETFEPLAGRGEVLTIGPYTIVDDTYNSNLYSAKEGLKTFSKIKPGVRHIAILGDMLELGDSTELHHRQLGHFINSLNISGVFCLGEYTAYTAEEIDAAKKEVYHFTSREELILFLRKYITRDAVYYLKGSRSMKMDKLIQEVFSH